VVVEVTLITALDINKASPIVVSGLTTLLFYIFPQAAVLLLTDVALGL
jgi:hypothetical protein